MSPKLHPWVRCEHFPRPRWMQATQRGQQRGPTHPQPWEQLPACLESPWPLMDSHLNRMPSIVRPTLEAAWSLPAPSPASQGSKETRPQLGRGAQAHKQCPCKGGKRPFPL